MSEKVTLPRDVADALDYVKSNFPNEEIIKYHSNDSESWNNKAIPLNGLPLMTLMSALVNGYTIEMTPEEKVRDYYDVLKEYADKGFASEKLACKSIIETLNLLGITIEGINGTND